MQGQVYGLDRAAARRRTGELLDALDLTALARRKVSDLSGGQRRRLDVALGLVHAPRLLFLDEPTTGLDPHNRANLWEHISRLRAEHDMTIVLTTHYLDEADTMAERVVVVDHGQVIADDTADGLKRTLAGDRVVLTVAVGGTASRVASIVEALPGARDVTVAGDRVEARVADAGAAVPELVLAASARRSAPARGARRAAHARRRLPGPHRPQPARRGSRDTDTDRPRRPQHEHHHRRRPDPHAHPRPPVLVLRRLARHDARAAARGPRAVLRRVRPGPAAGLPRPVRPAARRLGRGGRGPRRRRSGSGSCRRSW